MQNYTNVVTWDNGSHGEYKYENQTELEIQDRIDQDISLGNVKESYYYDEDGQLRFYWTKETGRRSIRKEGEKEMKLNKMTEEELENKMYYGTPKLTRDHIEEVIKFLKEKNLIEFKKEPKTFKAFTKIVTINGEDKKLYYKTRFHLTEKIEDAKLFDESEEKYGYAFELVTKLV